MKRTSLLATIGLALGLVFVATGCSTFSSSKTAARRPLTYALIVSVSGGAAPTDAQWATMQKKFGAMLAARGLTLVTDPTAADKLIQVLFVPDLTDPSSGISYVVAIRDNPTSLVATASPLRAAGYSYSTVPGFASTGLQPQYYGYFDDYSGNGSTVISTPSHNPPANHSGDHHVSKPVDCPPETPHNPPSGVAGDHGGGHWWNPRPSSDSGSSGYSSTSSSGSSYSSGSSMGPIAPYSSPTSSQSLSFPSSSSSSSDFSSSSSSSSPSFSSSSGSSGSSGSSSGTTNQKLD